MRRSNGYVRHYSLRAMASNPIAMASNRMDFEGFSLRGHSIGRFFELFEFYVPSSPPVHCFEAACRLELERARLQLGSSSGMESNRIGENNLSTESSLALLIFHLDLTCLHIFF